MTIKVNGVPVDATATNLSLASEARGGIPVRGASVWSSLAIGASGRILRSDGTDPSWVTLATAGIVETATLTTRGDLFVRGASAVQRLAVGASGRVLYSDGTDPSWATVSTILDGISSTRGTLLYRGAGGWAALAPSTAGYVLTDGGAGADPAWAAASGGGALPATIEDGGATVGALTTTVGSGGYGAIRVSGTVRDASGAVIQARGVCRFSGSGAGGTFYNITDYNGTRQHTTPGAAAGVTTMEGTFTFQTDASGIFDFKINWTGADPTVRVFVQCGAGVASTSGTIL